MIDLTLRTAGIGIGASVRVRPGGGLRFKKVLQMYSPKRPFPARVFGVVIACAVLDLALHRLSAWIFAFDYFDNGLPQSVLVKSGVFPIVALLGFSVMFGFVALNFDRARSDLGGTAFAAGQRFFAPFAFIIAFGVLEAAVVFPTPFKAELVTAIVDGVPYLLLGALLSRSARPEAGRGAGQGGQGRARAPWQSMVWIALCYVAGRYLISYPVLHIVSGYVERAAGTFAWTVGCGLSMGAFYWVAGSTFSAATPLRKALRVGVLTLGIFWLMVQLFYPLIFEVSLSDIIIRGVSDIVYLVAGVYSFETLFRGAGRRSPDFSRASPPLSSGRR